MGRTQCAKNFLPYPAFFSELRDSNGVQFQPVSFGSRRASKEGVEGRRAEGSLRGLRAGPDRSPLDFFSTGFSNRNSSSEKPSKRSNGGVLSLEPSVFASS